MRQSAQNQWGEVGEGGYQRKCAKQLSSNDILKLQDASGRWTMEEIPNSEKVFKADLVIIAAGFLGPEKTLAEQFGIKKVRRRGSQVIREPTTKMQA